MKLISSGQINRKKEWSCFESVESVNYVSMIDETPAHYRQLAVDQRFYIEYEKTENVLGGSFSKNYSENIKTNLRVLRKKCWIKNKGEAYEVISELYSYK